MRRESSEGPTISVVCPTYNSSGFILRTLESVAAQSYRPFEIIVSDDGSTDGTVPTVEAFVKGNPGAQAEIIRSLHRGPGAARNAGVRQARGDWIAFIDSDDSWMPRKLEVVVGAIHANPEANLICHSEEQVQRDGDKRLLDYGSWFDPGRLLGPQLYTRNLFSTSAVTCQKSMLLRAGLFDESLMSAQDYEMWLRMSPWIRPYFIREVLGTYYDRDGNISSSSDFQLWKNAIRIAVRHRGKVTMADHLCHLLRVTVSFGVRRVKKAYKGWRH